ncbi:Erv1p [Angomonas deanei]|uniref:Sulfhydryl oxidase n=1 Tax=Angomonas deanei TaxID=59799 RepID=A0A7G2CU01_9TRYP|nr:Erv1p [Angomonas deanei]CAD2221933.1 Erv1 / Alr family, putative [Angomonas deanei]|eukprot:EPY41612.1 Erv1p [Angomonas deanei]
MSDAPSRDIPGSPPSPIELGNAGWSILHSAAAVYPYKPTKEQKEAMKGFIYGWSHVYACNWCAYHMRRYVAEHPPVVDDKISVSRYICAFHNNVNEHVGNPTYSCDPDVLLRRWHPGYPNNMADHPSMEERVAAEEKKDGRGKAEPGELGPDPNRR